MLTLKFCSQSGPSEATVDDRESVLTSDKSCIALEVRELSTVSEAISEQ